jgi:hypothetical protein
MVLGWMAWLGWWVLFFHGPKGVLESVLAGLCLAGWAVLDLGKPRERAQRYGKASNALSAAIARYQAGDWPESTLNETARWACETAHAERIRTAPAWIRRKLRQCRLSVLGWFGPALLVFGLQMAGAFQAWHSVQPLWILGVCVVLFTAAVFRTRKLRPAVGLLGEAIDRYEYESAATESDLEEAGRRASER